MYNCPIPLFYEGEVNKYYKIIYIIFKHKIFSLSYEIYGFMEIGYFFRNIKFKFNLFLVIDKITFKLLKISKLYD